MGARRGRAAGAGAGAALASPGSAGAAASPASPAPAAAAAAGSPASQHNNGERRASALPNASAMPFKADAHGAPLRFPVVRFVNGRVMFISPACFTEHVPGEGKVEVMAIPLKLAWAISIHKSQVRALLASANLCCTSRLTFSPLFTPLFPFISCQGMSLDYMIANVGSAFAEGQLYVALSRARSPEQLQVVGFQERKVQVHSAVRLFHDAVCQKAPMPLSKSRLSLAAMHMESWERK